MTDPMHSEATKSSCPKCGSRDVVVRYHRGGWLCNTWSRFTNSHASGEHLHRFCERCGYDWTTDVLNAKAVA